MSVHDWNYNSGLERVRTEKFSRRHRSLDQLHIWHFIKPKLIKSQNFLADFFMVRAELSIISLNFVHSMNLIVMFHWQTIKKNRENVFARSTGFEKKCYSTFPWYFYGIAKPYDVIFLADVSIILGVVMASIYMTC